MRLLLLRKQLTFQILLLSQLEKFALRGRRGETGRSTGQHTCVAALRMTALSRLRNRQRVVDQIVSRLARRKRLERRIQSRRK